MKIWERHGYAAVPFVILGALLRRGAESIRLAYWRAAFGWDIGNNVRVHWTVHIPRKFVVRLGNDVVIDRGVQVNSDYCEGLLEVGANTNIAQHCLLDVSGGL